MAVAEIIGAAIAAIGALKKMDDDKRAHQEGINAAEQQMWDQRNNAILAKRDARMGLSPYDAGFARDMEAFHAQVEGNPFNQSWTPLVAAGGKLAGAIDKEAKTPRASSRPTEPTGEDIPGKNFQPAGNYAAPVNYSEWQPIEHRRAGPDGQSGNLFSEQAKRWQDEERRSLPEWLR